ncbi:radical SAM protein [bacterium]|nr:radical SAM protein [bacterium]
MPIELTERNIVAARSDRNRVNVSTPYSFLVEPERTHDGRIEDVATIFLTNRECPFKCLMCDLWRNTTEQTVPLGAIPQQIDFALQRLKPAQHLKLYNSGNFFDVKAIPRDDWPTIVERVHGFRSVIVENHPKLCGAACLDFRDRLAGYGVELEIAVGLETIHPDVLPRLNKQMTLDDYSRAVEFLVEGGIRVRSFVLLRPPFLDEDAGVDWALRSVEFAFDRGVSCCAVIPTRAGNGIMEQLAAAGQFSPPKLSSLETVLERGLALNRGRVFVDLWDARQFATCSRCVASRVARLDRMNLNQLIEPPIECSNC